MTASADPAPPACPDNAASAAQRLIMVDSQVRPNQVNDRRVIEAMRRLPRENYAPSSVLAYADADIPLGDGRYMLAPMLIGRLVQLVMMNNPARVLVVGAGAGYGAALLAACGVEVVALEEDDRFFKNPPPRAIGVQRVQGKLACGWPSGGPYDAILIEGAVPAIPPLFAAQLAPRGRVIAILADRSALDGAGAATSGPGLGQAVLAEPAGTQGSGGFATAAMFDCTARLLPAFRPPPMFNF